MPHLPYVQEALIFDVQKSSCKELRQSRKSGTLPLAGEVMFRPKPAEELYDLEKDPNELQNLAGSQSHRSVLQKMRSRLRENILETRDTGFLHESEMMFRSEGSTPYDMARDPRRYDIMRIFTAAEMVGDPAVGMKDLKRALTDTDSGVRFWAVQALIARGNQAEDASHLLFERLTDSSACVRLSAAEALCRLERCEHALPVLVACLRDQHPWLALQAATSIRHIGGRARPILPEVRQVLSGCLGNAMG